jgi:hypothetical protein
MTFGPPLSIAGQPADAFTTTCIVCGGQHKFDDCGVLKMSAISNGGLCHHKGWIKLLWQSPRFNGVNLDLQRMDDGVNSFATWP